MQATVNFSKEFGNVTERAGNLLQSGVNLSEEFMNKIEETNQVKKEYRDMEFEIATNAQPQNRFGSAIANNNAIALAIHELLHKKLQSPTQFNAENSN